MFKLSFLDIINKLKLSIESWKLLPLSQIGRVNVIKMVTLPKFLYLFQNLPIYLPATFFKQLDSVILSFVWNCKTPCIVKAHLQKPTDCGGLGLPNFKHYYWAANARYLTFWQRGIMDDMLPETSPLWVRAETLSAPESSLPTLLFTV